MELLSNALSSGVTDIHLQVQDNQWCLRWREPTGWRTLPKQRLPIPHRAVQWVQVQSGMETGTLTSPRDGGLHWQSPEGQQLYLRISIVPLQNGLSLVVRILKPELMVAPPISLGMPADIVNNWGQTFCDQPGLHLFTGPTGAGKTTTMFSLLSTLHLQHLKIMTAEDPVEYCLPGAVQVQINPHQNFGFGEALRTFFRHDPDVVVAGEIRDAETAAVVASAAVSGLRVLGTLHCEGANNAINRMTRLGVHPNLVKIGLRSVMTQCRTHNGVQFNWSRFPN
ncbi:MAG: Flp pilus assembly complex ATPase component TadA [Verrucomicrobia bacterium]|nr:Flp pilus assembly complex ATPase component TadA [Verrucomicrobiota bacterium]